MLQEFKAFVNQGNAIDLAVGVVIGAAFGKIVNSIVSDLIMPIASLFLGRVDFQNMFVPLAGQTTRVLEEARKQGAGATPAQGGSARARSRWSSGR